MFFTGKQGQVYPVEIAKGYGTKPVFGEYGSATKSNLTLTGQMLNALKYRIKSQGFELYIDDNTRESGGLTNAKVAEHVSENGRPFMAIAKPEKLVIIRLYQNIIRGIINKLGLS